MATRCGTTPSLCTGEATIRTYSPYYGLLKCVFLAVLWQVRLRRCAWRTAVARTLLAFRTAPRGGREERGLLLDLAILEARRPPNLHDTVQDLYRLILLRPEPSAVESVMPDRRPYQILFKSLCIAILWQIRLQRCAWRTVAARTLRAFRSAPPRGTEERVLLLALAMLEARRPSNLHDHAEMLLDYGRGIQ